MYPYFKETRPELARHEQAVAGRIVRDAIQYCPSGGVGRWRHPLRQACEIDPAGHLPGARIDDRDEIGLPDVCVQLPPDELQLVQRDDRPTRIGHADAV